MSGIDLSTLNDRQRQIVSTLDRPVFVEAGAGSGKTFTLTRRIAWALSPGSGVDGAPFVDDLSQVLVITFTNAAAAELRARIGQALLRRSQAEPGNTALRRQRMLLQRRDQGACPLHASRGGHARGGAHGGFRLD